jgi:hypothetical protein
MTIEQLRTINFPNGFVIIATLIFFVEIGRWKSLEQDKDTSPKLKDLLARNVKLFVGKRQPGATEQIVKWKGFLRDLTEENFFN